MARIGRHFGSGRLPRSDGPHRLVSDDEVCRELSGRRSTTPQLPLEYLFGLPRFPRRSLFADAPHRRETVDQRLTNLPADQLIGLTEDRPPLGMAEDHVADAGTNEHRAGDFSGESAALPIRAILRADDDGCFRVVHCVRELGNRDERGCNRDFDPLQGCSGGGLDERSDPFFGEVHFPVSE
jgi:hypothetical protein